VAGPAFLSLPERRHKPRSSGLTHVLDKGASLAATESVLQGAAAHIDIWKVGWGIAYVDAALPAKLALLAAADVRSCLGGTLLEIAWAQGKTGQCLDWAQEAGFDSVEVSRGVVPMPVEAKHALLARAAERFVVLSEVGSKDPQADAAPAEWTREVAGDLRAGATWVITEGRESGTVGLYRSDGSVREELLAAVLQAAGPDRLFFEAPRKDQQAWFVRRLGSAANLGNIPADEVVGLETLRLGLRSDTLDLLPDVGSGRQPMLDGTGHGSPTFIH
jgi:phosphosulfolactate synthase